MKYIALLVGLLFFCTPIKCQDRLNDDIVHASACYIISTATYSIVYKITQDKRKATIYGFTTAVTIGLLKEMHDIPRGSAELTDFTSNVIGAAAGVTILRITF